jgi:hypothetical protein
MTTFVLIHAPLAGPSTWSRVADELRSRGWSAVVLSIAGAEGAGPPYWPRYGAMVGRSLLHLPTDMPLALVAHSGAGFFLPLARQAIARPVEAYVFMDAVVPEDGLLPDEDGYFRRIAVDGFIPPFSEAALRAAGIEDGALRARLLSELRPLPLAVYEEPVPVLPGWPDAPCAYLRFRRTMSTAYERFAGRAQREGWPYRELDGGHFHMLVDPAAVAAALIELVRP